MDTVDIQAYIEIDVIGLAILAIIFLFGLAMYVNDERYTRKIFNSLIAINAVVLISDALSWGVDGKNNIMFKFAHIFLMCYFIGIILMCALWLVYCDFQLMDKVNRKKRFICYISPAVLFSFLMLMSIKFKWIYYYDDQNIYNRGKYYYVYTILIGGYIICSLILILIKAKRKSRIYRQDAYRLTLFAVPPIVCVFLQMIFYKMSLIPISTAIGLLIMFVQRQLELITLDSLTNLNNRRAFERFLRHIISNHDIEQSIFLVFIDLDDFKTINDTHGHQTGDKALKIAAGFLQRICVKGDFLARLGGDEFVMVVKRKSIEEVENMYKMIQDTFEKYSENNEYGYKLSCSMGYVKYDALKHSSIDEFLGDVDSHMYSEKRQKKEI